MFLFDVYLYGASEVLQGEAHFSLSSESNKTMFTPRLHRSVHLRALALSRTARYRAYASGSAQPTVNAVGTQDLAVLSPRTPKREGTIEDVFSFTEKDSPLPQRFSDLKREIFRPQLIKSWGEVLSELKVVTKQVASEGPKVMIPPFCCCEVGIDGVIGHPPDTLLRAPRGVVQVPDSYSPEGGRGRCKRGHSRRGWFPNSLICDNT